MTFEIMMATWNRSCCCHKKL